MLVYSVCMAISIALGLFCAVGGITLIFGSANVTLRSTVTALVGKDTDTGWTSLNSGSDCVCENWRLVNVGLLSWSDSSPIRKYNYSRFCLSVVVALSFPFLLLVVRQITTSSSENYMNSPLPSLLLRPVPQESLRLAWLRRASKLKAAMSSVCCCIGGICSAS